MGLLKNPLIMVASRGGDGGCGAPRRVRAVDCRCSGGDGAAPSASAAAASHVREDANAYGFGRNGSPTTKTTSDRRDTRMDASGVGGADDAGEADDTADGRTDGTADGRTDARRCLKTD